MANKRQLWPLHASCSSRFGLFWLEPEADTNAQVEAVTRKLLNWISHAGATPGKKRDRLLLLYQYLDHLGLSEEVEEVKYCGATYRLSLRQKGLREAQKGSRT